MVVLQDWGLTTLGTLLSPKKPRVKHREQKPRSRRQQMLYRWLERWNELLSWTVIFNIFTVSISWVPVATLKLKFCTVPRVLVSHCRQPGGATRLSCCPASYWVTLQ